MNFLFFCENDEQHSDTKYSPFVLNNPVWIYEKKLQKNT